MRGKHSTGKGSATRSFDQKKWDAGWEAVFGKKQPPPKDDVLYCWHCGSDNLNDKGSFLKCRDCNAKIYLQGDSNDKTT